MDRRGVNMVAQYYVLDLNFQGVPHTIAAYLIPHARGAVLVECGPGSTFPRLVEALAEHGYQPSDITDVLVTHIHLDHAGAVGHLARHGATIHVHPVGAPHLVRPERLLQSARRVFGELMDTLWGEFWPVPEEQVHVVRDEEEICIEGLRFLPLDTRGHAEHHYAYVWEGICFSGDIGGVRLPGCRHVRLPMPPPEFHLEKWRQSLQRLQAAEVRAIAPTHFGVFTDVEWHWQAVSRLLDEIEAWLERVMPQEPSTQTLAQELTEWMRQRALQDGLDEQAIHAYEVANPTWMSAAGLQRYWRKYRNAK